MRPNDGQFYPSAFISLLFSSGRHSGRCWRGAVGSISLLVTLTACTTDPLNAEYAGYSAPALTAVTINKQVETIDALLMHTGFSAAEIEQCMRPTTDDPLCKALRNQMTATLVMASEELCLKHRRSIYGKEATFNIATGSLTNLFAGWAAVASAERAKSILSALALFSNSERSLVNELVYKSAVVPAVDKKILQMRDTKGQALRERLNDPILSYPLGTAISDVLEFHRACSFMTGLEKAIEEGVQETARQKAERLKRDLLLLQAQLALYPTKYGTEAAKSATDPVYTALVARYQSMSDEVRTLEKQ